MKKLVVGAALASVATATLAACGSSGDPAASQAITSLKSAYISEGKTDTANPIGNDQAAGCFSSAIVSQIGVTHLKADGVLDAQGNAVSGKLGNLTASQADATTIVNALFNCVGEAKMSAALAAGMAQNSSLKPAVKACLAKVLTVPTVKAFMIADYQGKSSAAYQAGLKSFTTSIIACTSAK